MKITNQASTAVLILFLASLPLVASGPAGIYGVVSKVVFEPNDAAPERIKPFTSTWRFGGSTLL